MKVVGLISGGKDSCFNMMQCVASGHEIVALANITPLAKTEIDSFMYQTVGHEAIELIAKSMQLPLFIYETKGISNNRDLNYCPTDSDEVEDLYSLLKQIQSTIQIEAVSVGAILSDYQRIRVENVCSRLGLVPLAYLWQRNQHELLQEMIKCDIDAIIIKVAALGLEPSRHLGRSLRLIEPHLHNMHEKYGLNVCGEGGEYESLVLDCPLYSSRLIVEESEVILHSDDPIAAVGYLKFNKLKLETKVQTFDFNTRLSNTPLKDSDGYITDQGEEADEFLTEEVEYIDEAVVDNLGEKINFNHLQIEERVTSSKNKNGWLWIGGITGNGDDCSEALAQALEKLKSILEANSHTFKDVCSVCLYISDMSKFAILNQTYVKLFNHINPSTRACVEVPLPNNNLVLLEAVSWTPAGVTSGDLEITRRTLHVQSISHWAPANIGPYSQAVRVGDLIYLAGIIGLVPGSLELVKGGIKYQCQLVLRHINRILSVIDSPVNIRDIVQAVCYLTDIKYVDTARNLWETKTKNAIVNYVVVSGLPKGALVEWHVWAHKYNSTFECKLERSLLFFCRVLLDEETGKCINNCSISIYRRWNFENDIASIVCIVDELKNDQTLETFLSMEACKDIMQYVVDKLQQGEELPLKSVCNLKIHYVVSKPIPINTIIDVLDLLNRTSTIVYTLVPVVSVHNRNSFISISGIRM